MSETTGLDRRQLADAYRSAPLSVLALWQPWATLCVAPDLEHDGEPAKPHETRHWSPRDRRPFAVVIQATKTFNAGTRAAFDDPRFKEVLRRCGFYPGDPRPLLSGKMQASRPPVPLGALIGVATIISVNQMPGEPREFGEDGAPAHADDLAFGDWTTGRYAWRLAAALMFPNPVPFVGRQDALYPLDIESRDRVDAQLRAIAATPDDGDPSRVVLGQGAE